jgi:hypothetical protein
LSNEKGRWGEGERGQEELRRGRRGYGEREQKRGRKGLKEEGRDRRGAVTGCRVRVPEDEVKKRVYGKGPGR